MFTRFRLWLMLELTKLGDEISAAPHTDTTLFLYGMTLSTMVGLLVLVLVVGLAYILVSVWMNAWTWVAVLVTLLYVTPPILMWLAWPTDTKRAWRVIKGES